MASGSIEMTSSKGWRGKIYWSSQIDIANNCSYVSMEVYTWKTDGYPTSGGGWFEGSAWIGSEDTEILYEQEDRNWDEGEDGHHPIWRAEVSTTVRHNADGTGSVEIGASITKGYSTALAGVTLSGSKEVALDTIPKTSSFAATDAAIGSVSTITIYRESDRLYHRIKVTFGTIEGYVTDQGGFSKTEATITRSSVAFTIPTDFYYAIPDAQNSTCTLTLYTISNGVVVGEEVTTWIQITTVEARCNPTLTILLTHDNEDTAALTGSDTAYIRGYSDAKCTVSATGRYGATIVKIWTDGDYTDNKDGTYTINPVNSEEIVFYAKDSRGYTGKVSTTVTLVPYVVLTNNATAGRPNPTDGSAFIEFQGQYFDDSFGAVKNTLSIEYKMEYPDGSIDPSWTTVTPTKSENSYYAYISLSGFDYTKAFKVHTVVRDKLLTLEKTVLLKQGIPVFDWGKYDFQFHVPVYIQGNLVSVPQVLFTSEEYAGSSGNIELSEEASSFEYLEIFFNGTDGNSCNSLKVYNPEGKRVCLVVTNTNGMDATYIRRSSYLISGKRIQYEDDGGAVFFDMFGFAFFEEHSIRITRVVGHNRTTVASISNLYAALTARSE